MESVKTEMVGVCMLTGNRRRRLSYGQTHFSWAANARQRFIWKSENRGGSENNRDGSNVIICFVRETEMEAVDTEMAGGP